MSQQAVLITGASSGFGLEFARLFAKDGNNLVITAKLPGSLTTIAKELRETYGVEVASIELDLALPNASEKLFKWIENQDISITTLVNNAGLGLYGLYASHPLEKEKEVIAVNVNALSELCHLFIPSMIKQGGGKILNIASIAGFQPGPLYA